MAQVRSVNLGAFEPNLARRGHPPTGFHKTPVPHAEVRAPGPRVGGLGSGLVGDVIGEPRYHGGDLQAVYAVAREELDAWGDRIGRELPDGAFAENLTTTGVDVDAGRIGDRWSVGADLVLEVTGPRVPCGTFAKRMGVPGWTRKFTLVGRSGAYLRVVVGGTVRPGDRIVVAGNPEGRLLTEVFRELMGLDPVIPLTE